MTDKTQQSPDSLREHTDQRRAAALKKRHAAEKRFRWFGRLSIAFGLAAVLFLFTDIISKGFGAFTQTYVNLEVTFDADALGLTPNSTESEIKAASFGSFFKKSLRERYPDLTSRKDKRDLYALFTSDMPLILRDMVVADPTLIGTTQRISMIADDDFDTYYKHSYGRDLSPDEKVSRLSETQESIVDQLVKAGAVEKKFNTIFFSNSDSREPELAGIKGAVVGSILTLLVTLVFSFPIAVATAIYLEEFAPKNKITDFIEVNINNLAAVPSVIFGLLGLAVFINFFGLPRSVPLVGGFVLTLMTLPTIIISSRAAIKAVPPSIRDAAMGMGASKVQTVIHHVLPLAMPGMLTGTIIGMAQALGETAPLLMIGMIAFIVDTPAGVTDPATVLPVQIFLWSDSPERAFVEKTSAAIMVLLTFLICMNSLAVWLRKRLERRW
ncbi:phosphate transport system permease protein PstA [Arenicella chitinivorans]|uniref:Phosphate transport system permease protein PstA n=1 Tax=Arenicella chitinivorans TaxID=1329800 RepID=A0A918RYH5_9GAMM|nr:phosphate ABC transporter permease PstA [Arenicella chitinivorans]GHA15993.1 phosphate transport system permease protein PstA [Arenicella chitinivorans]